MSTGNFHLVYKRGNYLENTGTNKFWSTIDTTCQMVTDPGTNAPNCWSKRSWRKVTVGERNKKELMNKNGVPWRTHFNQAKILDKGLSILMYSISKVFCAV